MTCDTYQTAGDVLTGKGPRSSLVCADDSAVGVVDNGAVGMVDEGANLVVSLEALEVALGCCYR